MFIKFDDAFASFQLWLRANPNAAAKLPSKSFADTHDGRAFVQKYAKEWTNEMLFAYLLVAGCAEGSTFNCDDLVACATESQQAWLNGGDKTVRYQFPRKANEVCRRTEKTNSRLGRNCKAL